MNHKTHRLSINDNKTMCGRTNVQYLAMASWEGVDCKQCLKHIKEKAFEWKEG